MESYKLQRILQAGRSQTADIKVDVVATTNQTLQVALVNNTSSNNVWAYVSGLALNKSSAVYLLQSDGQTPYYPTSPSSIGSPLPSTATSNSVHRAAPRP